MPKIDPITGCEVMTFFEFIAAEAEHEGTTPVELMEDMNKSMAEEDERMANEYRKPEEALSMLKEWSDPEWEDWNESRLQDIEDGEEPDPDYPEPNRPEEVLEVIDASFHGGMSSSSSFILALVRCTDGNKRIAEYTYTYYSGSRMEPPDEDGELNWHECLEDYHHEVRKREVEKKEKEARRSQRIKEAKEKRNG